MALLGILSAHPAVADNPVVLENLLPGTTDWELTGPTGGLGCDGEASRRPVEGYTSTSSVDIGDTLRIFVSSTDGDYTLRIFRIGWYGGAGGREVFPAVQRTGIWQPMPPMDPVTGLVECRWTDPFVLEVPASWVSGVYLAQLTTVAGGWQNYVKFVVRDDSRDSDFLAQLSAATYQAYNCWGGKSLYGFNSTHGVAADKVSYDRPDSRPLGAGEFFYYSIHAVRWLEREGFDVSYTTNVMTHTRPDLLSQHRGFLSLGHDEYWSRDMRDHVQGLPDSVSVAFFGSNAVYWQIRFEPNSWGDPDRTIVGYKEDALAADPYALDADPVNDSLITVRWRDTPVLHPEASLIGVQLDTKMSESPPSSQDIVVTGNPPWVLEGTGLLPGDHLPGLLGHEVDRRYDSSPSLTRVVASSPFFFFGLYRGNSEMTIYPKGLGIVFATGSLQWAWGLDDYIGSFDHPPLGHPGAQALTRNILDRMINPPTVLDVPLSAAGGDRLRAWPVPFRAGTLNLALSGALRGRSSLGIYDINGRRIRTLPVEGSSHAARASWDGRDDHGRTVAPGLWFARLRADGRDFVARILVVR